MKFSFFILDKKIVFSLLLLGFSQSALATYGQNEICENEFKKEASIASEEQLFQCLQTALSIRQAIGFAYPTGGQPDPSRVASVTNYVDHWAYMINKALRTSDNEYIRKSSAKLDRLDRDLDRFPIYRGIVFRGSEFPPIESLEIGKIFTDKAFVSTSLDIEIAEGYVGVPGYLSVILSKSGRLLSYGRSTRELSAEKEVLFPRNRSFKVQNIYKSEKDKLTIIFLIEQ